MLSKYRNLYSYKVLDRSNRELDSKQDQFQGWIEEGKTNDILKYKITNTELMVQQWKLYIDIFGWILIGYGALELIIIILSIVLTDSEEYEVIKPDGTSDIIYDSVLLEIMNKVFFILSSISIIVLGIGWRNASSTATRTDTWKLCKSALFVASFQAVVILIRFIFAVVAISDVINKWQERHDIPAGNYVFKNKKILEQNINITSP